jgi:peptidoglycan/xylan/chitin deacetylase (PgdA/CDA1 family)
MAGIEPRVRLALAAGLDRCMDWCAVLEDYLRLSRAVDDSRDVVLMYHSIGGDDTLPANVPTDRFRQHVTHLVEHYEVVDLPAVVDATTGTKRVALTFDDGFANVCTEVLPVLREYGVPATAFVCPGFVDGTDPQLVERRLGVPSLAPDLMLSADQLRAVAGSDLVTVGSHTRTHPDLTAIDDPGRRTDEIEGARETLEAQFDVTVDRFAYPYGPFDEASAAIVREAYDIAVTGEPRLVSPTVDRYQIPRLGADLTPRRLRWEVTDLREAIERGLVGAARSVGRTAAR